MNFAVWADVEEVVAAAGDAAMVDTVYECGLVLEAQGGEGGVAAGGGLKIRGFANSGRGRSFKYSRVVPPLLLAATTAATTCRHYCRHYLPPLLQLTAEEKGRVVERTKNCSNTSPLPAVAAKCLAIDQMVFINAGDDTEQELRKWMEEHTGEGSYTGARLLGGNEAPAEHA